MNKFIVILTLMLFCIGVFNFTVFASSNENSETLIVNAAWLDGETIRIDVTDPQTGLNSSIAVPLADYLDKEDNSEFIAIQAVDLGGKQSGVIEIRNPFYNPNLPQNNSGNGGVSAIQNPESAFTPDGTGTTVDNVTENDGKEFFTIYSEDGNEFFLIIDRERNNNNVYFLNAVTEEDLMSLAKRNGREIKSSSNGESAITVPTQPIEIVDEDSSEETPEPQPTENSRPSALNRIGRNFLTMGVVVVVVGGGAYYFKIVRPRKNAYSDDEGDPHDYDGAMDGEDEKEWGDEYDE